MRKTLTKSLMTIILLFMIFCIIDMNGQSLKTERQIRFENWNDNSKYVILSVNPLHNSQLHLKFPLDAGVNGQFLTTDGTGIMSWSYPDVLPVLDTGSIIFSGGNTTLSQDNSNLFWNNSSKRLGIGTNSPQANLDVNGSLKVGNGGAPIFKILRKDTTLSVGGLVAGNNGWKSSNVYVPGAVVGANVIVNPRSAINTNSNNIFIAYSYVSAENIVTIVFSNSSNTSSSFSNKQFDIMVIQ